MRFRGCGGRSRKKAGPSSDGLCINREIPGIALFYIGDEALFSHPACYQPPPFCLMPSAFFSHFLHRPDTRRGKRASFGKKVLDDFVHRSAQVSIHLHRIVTVNSGNQIRTFPQIRPVFLAPFDPFVILVRGVRSLVSSIARSTRLQPRTSLNSGLFRPFQGFLALRNPTPRALPRADMSGPFGALSLHPILTHHPFALCLVPSA